MRACLRAATAVLVLLGLVGRRGDEGRIQDLAAARQVAGRRLVAVAVAARVGPTRLIDNTILNKVKKDSVNPQS